MKLKSFIFLFVLSSDSIYSQNVLEQYYNFNWKKTVDYSDASFVIRIKNTDSGWLKASYYLTNGKEKLEMVGLYKDKMLEIENGSFYWLYATGILKKTGQYINGKREGLWRQLYQDGSLKDSTVYHNDKIYGSSVLWYKNGNMRDSIAYDETGSGSYYEWFSNSAPSCGGRYINYKKVGKWVYYHLTGEVSSLEVYNNDSLITGQYFNEDGSLCTDTTKLFGDAEFNGGGKAWNKYVTSYLHSPSNMQIIGSDRIAVVAEFVVNEDGSVDDVEIVCPFQEAYDIKVLRFIKASPKWLPSKNHNRKFQQTIRMPIVFSQFFN